MPESLRALFRIVSLTAANTSRMFDVSVAWVRLLLVRMCRVQKVAVRLLTEDKG